MDTHSKMCFKSWNLGSILLLLITCCKVSTTEYQVWLKLHHVSTNLSSTFNPLTEMLYIFCIIYSNMCLIWCDPSLGRTDSDICDPTRVNEADVIWWPNCDFSVNVFYRTQKLFQHKNHFDTIFHSKDMRRTKLTCWNFKNLKICVLST